MNASSILLLSVIVVLGLGVLAWLCWWHWYVLPVKRVIVARLKAVSHVDEADLKLARFTLVPVRSVSWPREWTSPQEANERGAGLLHELWPNRLPLPATSSRSRWTQKARKV